MKRILVTGAHGAATCNFISGLELGTGDKPTKLAGVKMLHTDLFPKNKTIEKLDANKRFPFKDDFFDVVVAYGILEHVKDFYFTVNEIHRILKEGGMFYCDLPHFSSSIFYWEPSHDFRNGHSRIFHSYVEERGDKAMRGQSQNRRFVMKKFDYTITFGKIIKPLLGKGKLFRFYERYFARGFSPLQIDFLFFILQKKGYWGKSERD